AATEKQIREFVAGRIAYFKVPRRVIVLDAIPKGATGKPQRIGLYEKLGLTSVDATTTDETPVGPVHEILSALWAEVLGAPPVTMRTSFFDAGGDSLLATQFVMKVAHTLAVELSLLEFFDGPTVADVGALVAPRLDGATAATGADTTANNSH
ncbi:MAG TPA: phosphopantetheine-binding protein, partial [Candidatus Elarobacter sp.]|nr:phosphopantetheine-binding protein [Candidatus Elarobacter sp.]